MNSCAENRFRRMSRFDDIFGIACSVFTTFGARRVDAMPAALINSGIRSGTDLTSTEKQLSGALMRINHVGEVCAQALYESQALFAKTPAQRANMLEAAKEEASHLAWTGARLHELGARPSYLNPVWYLGSFLIGAAAASRSDAISLAFVVETERQVEAHLAGHLIALPLNDERSRLIVEAMRADEERHAEQAMSAGAGQLPSWVPTVMRWSAGLMTKTARYI